MNYYLIETEYPKIKLRHYRNSRVAKFALNQLNTAACGDKYMIITDDGPVVTVNVRRAWNVDPYAPAEQVLNRLS